MQLYNYHVKNLQGERVPLSTYEGKVLLVVNTATECGLTPQYDGLQELYKTYHDRGFEILDFPSNQFNEQAPGTSVEINQVCKGRFGISFEQFAKIDVNGDNADPLFLYLQSQKKGRFGRRIKWNFTKFLIDREGHVIKRFAPTTPPDKLRGPIEALL